MTQSPFTVAPSDADKTLAALLRQWLPGQTWTQVRRLIAGRFVSINGEAWLDDARRLKAGDTVTVSSKPAPVPKLIDNIVLRHVDAHVVVVEKPAGISTMRHPAERAWNEARRLKVLTLDDLVARQTGGNRLRIVQRLDKETSGLVVFARTVEAERGLGMQFRRHTVMRRYLALVAGEVGGRTIRTHLVRDRGDGRRGSTPLAKVGKEAVTHIEVEEELVGHTLLSCRLETGRTHQIRIHLAEIGHPVLGEKVYAERTGDLKRFALHAVELGFRHPVTEEEMLWTMPPPPELRELLDKLRVKS